MGSIIKKVIKGKPYYYYTESKRIDGKPKLVNQKYLGSADSLLHKVLFAGTPLQNRVLYSREADYGDVALLYDIASRLGIVSVIDRHFPKRGQGASVGMYILIEAINRAAHPTSMANLEQWYAGTCLPLLTGLGAHLFSSQNFWNNTACLDVQTIQAVEDDMLRLVVHTYGLDAGEIVYDASNFFTYIDSSSTCACAQRGHDKAKRTDLKTVGLALMVAGDYAIPLLHETYPGNRADSIEFKRMMQSLKSRIQYITGAQATVTVVFDRGNNSEENMRLLEQGPVPCHYVGGLKRNQSADMFSIPKSGYTALDQDRFPGQSACRRRIKAYGRELTAVVWI